MPVAPAVDADKRGGAYKKVKPVEGIDEQGLVPDPQVMHVLFARLMAILGHTHPQPAGGPLRMRQAASPFNKASDPGSAQRAAFSPPRQAPLEC